MMPALSRHRLDHRVDRSDDTKEAPARLRRIAMITGVERRRKCSAREKAEIVAASLVEGAVVCEVARRHGPIRSKALGADPLCGTVYVFRAKRTDRAKRVWRDGTGLCLLSKRLEGGQFCWPRIADGVKRLTPAQLKSFQRIRETIREKTKRTRRQAYPAMSRGST
jgi:hypothetical protein